MKVIVMSYQYDASSKTYLVSSKLNDDELYDTLLSIAKEEGLIEANHASSVAHMFSILRGGDFDVSLIDEEE
jgi:hypothetical protein